MTAESSLATITAYDEIEYPTSIFNPTQPDRLATVARLAGLNPPPVETARVLEIAGGDGMNLLALGVAYPGAEFISFDLAQTAVARGEAWREAAGLDNVRVLTMDILDAADALDGEFDYIIAHGLYAWVPQHVRDATMALIGRKLSANGVAFVSYNALPGGYLRHAVRDALNFALEGVPREDRKAVATQTLEALAAETPPPEFAPVTAFRESAKQALRKGWPVLCHDELGDSFKPEALINVVRNAEANGLRFLGDADRERMSDTFLPPNVEADEDVETQIVRLTQASDYRNFNFFRMTLLVRAEQVPSRSLDHDALNDLYVSSRAIRHAPGTYRITEKALEFSDDVLIAMMDRLVDAYPNRIKVSDLVDSPELRTVIFRLFDASFVDLSTLPPIWATSVSERPLASPLVRTMLAEKMTVVCRLDHRLMTIGDDAARRLLAQLDGTRTRADLTETARAVGLMDDAALEGALASYARECVLVA
ncbi:class I SAM-dependent methyltransferase [Sphingomonas immobilis]|uniref:Class I SAM-dependent methyltransferase n=1 Tax=Sphingomonas immobilis TaxID=3063997 RepID=A0ABT9A575_9SPHN|nr:class I SAM-dependent methyltransferase [Sphingomonas sp. CA1-15]MDO7844577.1 class I SAM-dependent methyltransferase [Sphingomonas sp. CA1-15]